MSNPIRQAYIDKYSPLAVRATAGTRLFPSVLMAQAIVESYDGRSRLAREGNNHFGIKCHSSWKGKTMLASDDKPNECFRVYDSVIDSYNDRNKFLIDNKRYTRGGVFRALTAKAQMRAIAKAGYASNSQYASVLIGIMDQYNLYSLDQQKKELPLSASIQAKYDRSDKVLLVLKVLILTFLIVKFFNLYYRNRSTS